MLYRSPPVIVSVVTVASALYTNARPGTPMIKPHATQQKSNVRAVICCAESTCDLGHGEASTRVIVDDQVGTVEVPPEANVNCESGLRLVMEVVRCIEHGRARAQ
jgi:hypothetical protein